MPGSGEDRLTPKQIADLTRCYEDQADELLAASSASGMDRAAQRLRVTALSVRRLLICPALGDTFLQIAPSVPNPELRRMELADLATDVVTAADYLLSLLGMSAAICPQLVLASEASSDCDPGRSDDDALDRLTRRRLDARGTAVRLGMRLLAGLRSDIANDLAD